MTRSAHGSKRAADGRRGSTPPGRKQGGGILRIDFDDPGGEQDERLEEISWDEWFRTFAENGLAFLHQDRTDGGESRFNKLVSRKG